MSQRSVAVLDVADAPAPGWDASTVAPVGGNVLQSVAWANHRRSAGWRPHFVSFGDGRRALLLTRRQPPLPGFLAYAPRGPISAGDAPERVARRCIGLADWVKREAGTILAVDPVLDASPAYDALLRAARFRATEEIQPSRHRLVLSLPAGGDEDVVMGGFTKTTRQRIRAAQKQGIVAVEDEAGLHLDAFAAIMSATAERRSFTWSAEAGFRDWWQACLAAGHGRFLVALHDQRLIGGLILYRQAGHYATAFSADRAERRAELPGAMHLLRWTAIREALAAGMASIDLGGVDLPGVRRRPQPGDPSWGMYQHKTSFGAEWIESVAAQDRVFRPFVYALGNALALTGRTLRGARRGR